MTKRRSAKKWLTLPGVIWMIGFTVIPLIMIAIYAFTGSDGSFTWSNLAAITTPENVKALLLSLKLSLICTVVCIVLAYPLALILKSRSLSRSSFIVFIFVLPMWMNFLLRTYAWQTLLEKNGVINGILNTLHLPNINIINTESAIVLGMVYNFLPFMVLPIYNVLVKIDDNVINAAKDLGANSVQTFAKIIFPMSLPGVVSGITMVFVPALTTFVVSDLLGGAKILLIGNVIEHKFTTEFNWNVGSGLSLVLMIFILLCMAFLNFVDKDGEGTAL
ncbi:MAG: ABC transporter permease [Lachnospiraceae bacterium]|nr:ABC transporter permease [Cuneatibacter sp.]MDD6456510.1 ABC transporter permease [Lachnospiraceae bacterium]